VNNLLIPTDDYTLPSRMFHGRGADERPADIDVRSRVPNLVISQNHFTSPCRHRRASSGSVAGSMNPMDGTGRVPLAWPSRRAEPQSDPLRIIFKRFSPVRLTNYKLEDFVRLAGIASCLCFASFPFLLKPLPETSRYAVSPSLDVASWIIGDPAPISIPIMWWMAETDPSLRPAHGSLQ